MKTTCPKCNHTSTFRGNSGRKLCPNCKKKYKITPLTNPKIANQKTKETQDRYFLSELDILILSLLKSVHPNGKYQQQLADETKFHKTTIYRRLEKLKSDGLVKMEPIGYPKIWKLNEIPYVSTHKHQFVCDILHGKPKITPKKTIKMKNWEKKIFEIWLPTERIWIQNAELNTESIVFWLETEEKSTELAIQKANDQAFLIKNYLETKYNIKLTHPKYMKEEGNQTIHGLPKYGTQMVDREINPKDPTLSSQTFTDNSPEKNTIESGFSKGEHRAYYDTINEKLPTIEETIQKLGENLEKLAEQMGKITTHMQTLAENQGKTNDSMMEGFKVMTEVIGQGLRDFIEKRTEKPEKPITESKEDKEGNTKPSNIYL